MRRETRIGLGVGLLFILGFGLILSEMTNKSNSPPAENNSGDNDAELTATSRHVRSADRSQMRIGNAVEPPPSHRRSAPQRDRRVEAANVMLAATAERDERSSAQADSTGRGQGVRRSSFHEMDAQQLAAHLQRTATAPTTQVYVVRSGDTLTGIARRFMGDGSWATVEKLYQMNRSTLSDPDRLAVGMRLIVPTRPGRNN